MKRDLPRESSSELTYRHGILAMKKAGHPDVMVAFLAALAAELGLLDKNVLTADYVSDEINKATEDEEIP